MKLEVGKFYKARNGHKIQVLCTDRLSVDCPVIALNRHNEIVIYYHTDGRQYQTPGKEHDLDLLKEWVEPITRSIDIIWTAPSIRSGNIPAPQIVPKGFTPSHSEGKIIKRETVSCTYYPE